jgi:hypothetical protein
MNFFGTGKKIGLTGRANTEACPYGWTANSANNCRKSRANTRFAPTKNRFCTDKLQVRPVGGFFALLLLLVSTLALATTYPKLSLETQLERAEVIVRATVKEVLRQERNKRPWMVYTLDTKQHWRGEGLLPKTSEQPSFAIYGNDKIKLEGAPSFKVGEEWIFLLYTKNYDSPIVGFNQGAYKLESGTVLDVNNKPVLLDGKPATRESFIAAVEKILGVVR